MNYFRYGKYPKGVFSIGSTVLYLPELAVGFLYSLFWKTNTVNRPDKIVISQTPRLSQ